MSTQPRVTTERLSLRPFVLADAAVVQRLAGDRAVADTTLNVPHPYEDGVAEQWIGSHAGSFAEGRLAAFAITLATDGRLIGTVGLRIDDGERRIVRRRRQALGSTS